MPKTATKTNLDLVRCYLREIGRVPMLTREQEQEYGKLVQQMMSLLKVKEGLEKELSREPTLNEWAAQVKLNDNEIERILQHGQSAKQKMISANLRLVVAIAKKYQHRGLELLDLIQEGTLGLTIAVEKFDPMRGFKFSTYSYFWIRQAITRALATDSRTIRIPVHITEKLNKIKKISRELSQQLGRTPTVSEIAQEMSLTTQQLHSLLCAARKQPASLDQLVGREQDTPLGELLEDETAFVAQEDFVFYGSMRNDLEQIMAELTLQEQEIISLRYGLEGGLYLSLAKIGQHLNLSRERIRQIEAKALLKLRQYQEQLESYR